MKSRYARRLHRGDEVTWNDPDGGICTRTLTIMEIHWEGEVAQITDMDGEYLECLAEELS